jgi:hypothetical protein
MTDNGHELIHVVVFKTLGESPVSFLVEGFAEAFQLDYNHPIERFVSYCTMVNDSAPFAVSIADQITENRYFNYSYFSYLCAGAFIKYLVELHGISKVKEMYRASILYQGDKLKNHFTAIFGSTIEESEQQFLQKYFSRRLVESDSS